MNRISVSTLGFDLTREVPSTVDEYNALAPKRTNPVLEDAVDNILYRNTFADFRSKFLDALEKQTGIGRINHGTEEEPQWESDARFMKRIIAQQVMDGSTEAAFRASVLPLAQQCMDAAPFNPAERESTGTGPTIGKRDLALAAQVIKDGKANVVASKLAGILGRDVAVDEKSLARAIADNRRALAAAAELAQKAQLGL